MVLLLSIIMALSVVGVANAGPISSPAKPKSAPVIDPVTLKVNEAVARQLEGQAKARDAAWDMKLKKTMSAVCRGC